MITTRGAWRVVATCAVLSLLVLPALPDGSRPSEDLQWLLSAVIATTGIVALVVAVRGTRRSRR